MSKRSMKTRYDAFCQSALDLLEEAGFKNSGDKPRIVGRAFYKSCMALGELHFPEDYEYGSGPHGLLQGMCGAVMSSSIGVPDPDPVVGARSIAQVLKEIVKHRPALDVRQETSTGTAYEQVIRNCSFFEKSREYRGRKDSVFVLMPFNEKWSDRLWEDHLKKYLAETPGGAKLLVRRADDMFGQGVMEDIYEGIVTAHLILADCTGKNPNVLYELGIAHSLGKRTALLSQREEDIPFDLRRFRFCIYEDNSSGYPRLESYLQETLREAFGKGPAQ
jgi:hypothetical protein